jgi:hypothetical protein
MNCDLCNRTHNTGNLLCDVCADMIHRLTVVSARMNTREVSEAERLATATAVSGMTVASTNVSR